MHARTTSWSWLFVGTLLLVGACRGSLLDELDASTGSDASAAADDGGSGDAGGGQDAEPLGEDGGPPGTDAGPDVIGACGEAVQRPSGQIPNVPYPEDMRHEPVSPTLARVHNNQPSVVDGYLLLSGNAQFTTWDLSDLSSPRQLAEFESEFHDGEAESHQVTFARRGDRFYAATTSGRGFDIWDLTDMRAPTHVSHVRIPDINYGDVNGGVWGLAWQGDRVYVGGNNTGLHIVDVSNPESPDLVRSVANAQTGGFYPGPLFAMGNLLIVTTPKSRAGVATLDISDRDAPVLLDSEIPSDDSYIGWYYAGHVFLQRPLRAYDVLSDPTSISRTLGGFETDRSEYFSFGDDQLFLGLLRGKPGVVQYDISDIANPVEIAYIEGRTDIGRNDDQFSLKVGNLIVLSDDQMLDSGFAGSIILVQDTAPDTTPPRVNGVWPSNGATVPAGSAIGISFSDQIELATVNGASFSMRQVDSGDCIPGTWGRSSTVLNFTPQAPLSAGTYEVTLTAGGITDLGGNAIAEDYRTTFTVR